jgi:hypothetical protein
VKRQDVAAVARQRDDTWTSIGAERVRPGASAVVLWLLLTALLSTWAMGTARYGGPDEPAHIIRAAAVASGDLRGDRAPALDAGWRVVTVPAGLGTGDPSCFRHSADAPAVCAHPEPGQRDDVRVATSAGTYPPLYYAVVGLTARVIGDRAHAFSYRLGGAIWCALVLTLAIARARRRGRGAVPLICLPPAAWFLFGVVNPNSLEIALAVLSWIAVADLVDLPRPTPRDVAWFAVPAAIAIAIRPIAFVFWTIAVLVVLAGRAIRMRVQGSGAMWPAVGRELRADRRHWIVLLAPPAVGVAAVLVWSRWSEITVLDERTASPVAVVTAIRRSFDGTSDTLREIAGSLGWLEFSAPSVVQAMWWGIVGVSAVGGWRAARAQRSMWVGAWWMIVATVVVFPVVFETVEAGAVGFIWQGRYSIPTAVGALVLGLWSRPSARLHVLLLAVVGVAEVTTFWYTLRRYTVGIGGSRSLTDARWHPPLNPWLLIAMNIALVVAVGLVAMNVRPPVRRMAREP